MSLDRRVERCKIAGFLALVLATTAGACATDVPGVGPGGNLDASTSDAPKIAADVAGTDTASPVDVLAGQDLNSVADLPPQDSGPVDTGVFDAGPVDTGPADTGPLDVGAVDAGPADAGANDPCVQKANLFNATQVKALQCTTQFQCFHPASSQMLCPCQIYYSDATLDWQNLTDVEAEAKPLKCSLQCGATCGDMATEVGVCTTGKCETITPTCKQLDAFASAALAEGKKCTADADCSFQASNSLGCGCGTFTSIKAIGPGKPLFKYMLMLVNAYKNLKCTSDVSCACPKLTGSKCVQGLCQDLQ